MIFTSLAKIVARGEGRRSQLTIFQCHDLAKELCKVFDVDFVFKLLLPCSYRIGGAHSLRRVTQEAYSGFLKMRQ